MTRSRTRDGRREVRATAQDRLLAKLSTQRGTPLSGGDVARMREDERRRLYMRLGFLSGRASAAELRVALVHLPGCTLPVEHGGACRTQEGPTADATRRTKVLPPTRVSEAELAEIRRLAAQAGLSVSEWIRTRALSGSRPRDNTDRVVE